jgi:hypothetical protein
MSEPDFTSLLKKSASEVTRPWAFPAGTYTLQIIGYEFGKSSKKETPFCRYKFNVTAFDQDVDPADLEGKDWQKKEIRDDFYLTENAMFRLVDFLESCGVNTAGRQLDELVPEAVGKMVKAAIVQTPNQRDPAAAGYNEITTYVKVI